MASDIANSLCGNRLNKKVGHFIGIAAVTIVRALASA
jgi:hypothetical protein